MKVSHLSLAYGVKKIYDDANFILENDDKVGIVGVNGAGKTTLIKILRGELVPDSAEIDLPGTRFAYLPQEIATTDEDQEKNRLGIY